MVVHASQPPPVHHYNYRCLVKSAAPEPRIAAASGGNSSTQGSQPGTMRGGGGDAFFRFASDAFFRAYDGFSSAPTATADVGRLLLGAWEQVRSGLVVPLLRAAVVACMVMSVIVLAEKVFLGTVSLAVKLLRRRPERLYRCDPIAPQDKEAGSAAFPMVLVQIPMYNEKEVYQLSIGAACRLTWPADRLLVQVLDDSTEAIIKELVKSECEKWAKEGINIRYETRKDRAGYKAGNLREGMKHGYVRDCEFVAMFDADFQPAPDFLVKTIPFLVNNPRLALVQTRWKFVNANDCFLTRMQEMSMDYHFKVEQEAGSSLFNFFGYNGTAGVWRTQAIVEPGGWEDRTTAEDMDLAYRAGLLGWEFLYVGSIKVKSELPSTLKAYRSQQHRWSCGPAVLLKKMFWEILSAKKVSALKKFYMIFNFFIARRTLLYLYTFLFFSMLLPMNIIFPEVQIPTWQLVYVPAANTLLNSVGTPRSIHLIVIWFLFENVMALHRLKATLIGIFEAGRANEWIVTQKLGNAQKLKSIANGSGNCHFKNRFHRLEIFIGLFLLLAACYDYLCRADYFYFFVLPQSIMYFAVGFQFIGLNISN